MISRGRGQPRGFARIASVTFPIHPPSIAFCCSLVIGATTLLAASDDDDATPVHHKKKSAAAAAKATPAPKKPAADDDDKPVPKRAHSGTTGKKSADSEEPPTPAKATPVPKDDDQPAARTPHAGSTRKKPADADDSPPPKTPPPDAAGIETPAVPHAPPVSIASSALQGFSEQPAPVRQLIEDALALAQQNLTYKFGSDDPANGGMDCSGTIAYLLRGHGFKEVPRDASGQYIWVRKNDRFFAVNSKKGGGFEFTDLLPGDLMFWSGTYTTGTDRDPPVSHTMMYLGVERGRKQQVMWGASDGRTYDGKARWGVSVFDFRMPRTDSAPTETHHAVFIGYGRIPGLREPATEPKTPEKPSEPAPEPPPRKRHSK